MLRKVVGRKRFLLEQLVTLLIEIEEVLNLQHLTYVYQEMKSGFVLTSTHF